MATVTLPTLTGSAKQIAWAEDIRQQAIAAYEARLQDETSERRAAGLRAALTHISHETLAEWFLDQRRELAAVKPNVNPMTNAETLRESPRTTPYRCACIPEFRRREGFNR